MEKKHQKRGKEESTRSPTLIYTTSCKEVKGREIVSTEKRERDQISSMKIGGDILIGGVTLFPMMSKGRKRKIRSMKTGGATPKGDTLFHCCWIVGCH
jgi:hypothetical protein